MATKIICYLFFFTSGICNVGAGVGRGADLLSHEATFSKEMAPKAAIAKHSTAAMAGAFARRLGAAQLVLTHFSSRYVERRETVCKSRVCA